MSMLIAALLFVPLLAIAMAHFIWSLGATWPIRDRELLQRTVMGFPAGARLPSRLGTFVVSIAIVSAGVIALSLADKSAGGLWLTALGALMAAVFISRGVAGYTAWFARRTPQEPFRSLDRKFYSPLCLFLGAGFVILCIMRLI